MKKGACMRIRRTFFKITVLALTVTVFVSGAAAESCLWKVVSGNGTLYLQGSVHVLRDEHYPLAPAIEEAYTASDALVLEVDMKEMASAETQQKLLAKAVLKGSDTLRQTLSEETYRQLSEAFTGAGMPVESMAKFKPWFACMTLTMIKIQRMGFNPQLGLDTYFFNKASAEGKPVIGLESIDFQINLFDSLAEADPNAFVHRTLADLALIEEEVATLEKAWETGDIDALGELMSRSFRDYPEFYKTFVLDRNKRWLEKLIMLMKSPHTHMVVVGAGHLDGEGGLLELLKKEGCTLEQL
jgi:uncharacterized protein YbaP (TraB family)